MTASSPRQVIAQIDRQISQIHFGLEVLETIDPFSAASWQAAWDKHPEMQAQERELYRQRGVAQLERDNQEHRAAKAAERQVRAQIARRRPCPTCGLYSHAA